MKKLIFLFSILALAIGMTSCQSIAEQKLSKAVEEADKSCPLDMGMAGQLTSMTYDKATKYVICTVETNEDIIDMEYLKQNSEEASSSLKLTLSQDDDTRKLLKLMSEAGAGMKYIYEGNLSGNTCEVSISSEDVKEIYDNPVSEEEINKAIIETTVRNENNRCPYTVEHGMQMVNVADDGEYLIYTCSMDEDWYDLDSLEGMKSDIKGSIAESFCDQSMQNLLKALRSQNRGLIYRYIGDQTGKQVDIVYDSDDLWMY